MLTCGMFVTVQQAMSKGNVFIKCKMMYFDYTSNANQPIYIPVIMRSATNECIYHMSNEQWAFLQQCSL